MTNLNDFLVSLANTARPINNDDWGSERQINAMDIFFYHAECTCPAAFDDDFEAYCLKATDEEMIDEALRRLGV